MGNILELHKKYNMWTIKSKRFKKNGRYYVKAVCDCGKEVEVKEYNIKNGSSKSCGCWTHNNLVELSTGKTAWNSKSIEELAKRELYEQYKHSAKKGNYSFNLTKSEFNVLIDKSCKYCGTKESNAHIVNNKKGSYNYNGIDRVNNNLGYTSSNVVTCCKTCNTMKLNLGIENFFEHIFNIVKYNQVKLGINEDKLDSYYERAKTIAANSHDNQTKVGALLINNKSGAVIADGFNGFVRGAPDKELPNIRPEKYQYIIHAEENLICNAVRHGIKTDNCVIFCTLSPCKKCLRLLYQAGVNVIYYKDTYGDLDYSQNMGDLKFNIVNIGNYNKIEIKGKDV